ncbi:MAG: prepilin peptidase [Alphaproteobacteria bacterium]|nr:prepilin peptidase [Alphaproteobacteria bacterium]
MIVLIIFLICVFISLGVGVLAGASDIKSMTIPNSYSVYVALSFALAYAAVAFLGVDGVFSSLSSHLLSAGLMFGFTFMLFGLRMIGAADSKFGTACALWFSARDLPVFIVYMACAGGVLALASLVIQRKKPFAAPAQGSWIEQVQGGASKVPYGVAIAIGMGFAFVKAGYFSTSVLSSFLPVAGEGQAL